MEQSPTLEEEPPPGHVPPPAVLGHALVLPLVLGPEVGDLQHPAGVVDLDLPRQRTAVSPPPGDGGHGAAGVIRQRQREVTHMTAQDGGVTLWVGGGTSAAPDCAGPG